jgi:hypothetical protein
MLAQNPLGLLDVGQRQLAGARQVRHHRLDLAVEHGDELVDDPALRVVARDRRFEDVRVADALDDAERTLCFQAETVVWIVV